MCDTISGDHLYPPDISCRWKLLFELHRLILCYGSIPMNHILLVFSQLQEHKLLTIRTNVSSGPSQAAGSFI